MMRSRGGGTDAAAQAQLALHHPNEALSSAIVAYELCVAAPPQQRATDLAFLSGLVLRCKRAKWELHERDRVRRRHALLAELATGLEADFRTELDALEDKARTGDVGPVAASEERQSLTQAWQAKDDDLRTAFTISDPDHLAKREVPDWMVDAITFEIMHDRETTAPSPARTDVAGSGGLLARSALPSIRLPHRSMLTCMQPS